MHTSSPRCQGRRSRGPLLQHPARRCRRLARRHHRRRRRRASGHRDRRWPPPPRCPATPSCRRPPSPAAVVAVTAGQTAAASAAAREIAQLGVPTLAPREDVQRVADLEGRGPADGDRGRDLPRRTPNRWRCRGRDTGGRGHRHLVGVRRNGRVLRRPVVGEALRHRRGRCSSAASPGAKARTPTTGETTASTRARDRAENRGRRMRADGSDGPVPRHEIFAPLDQGADDGQWCGSTHLRLVNAGQHGCDGRCRPTA